MPNGLTMGTPTTTAAPFTTGAPLTTGAPAGVGGAAAGMGGIGEMIQAIRSALGGAVGGGADWLSLLLGGRAEEKGFGDLESQLRAAMGGQQQALTGALTGLAPFQQAGAGAVGQELQMLQAGQDPTAMINQITQAFQQSPAQRATIQAGLGAVQNRLAAQGLGQSGLEQKALEQFAQGTTAQQQQQYLQDVLTGRGQTLSGLGQLGGMGLGAATTGGQFQMQSAENMANLLESLGQTQLAQQFRSGQRTGGEIGSLASILQSIL